MSAPPQEQPKIVRKRKIDQVSVEDFKNLAVIDETDVKDVLDLFEDMSDQNIMKHFAYKHEIMSDTGLGKTRWGLSATDFVRDSEALNQYTKYLLDDEFISEGSPVFLYDFELRGKTQVNDSVVYHKDVKRMPMFKPDKRAFQYDPIQMLNIFWKSLLALFFQYDHGTIIIDTSTQLGDLIRKYIQYLLMTRGAKFARLEEVIQMALSDWQVRNDMMHYLYAFQNLTPFHWVWTTKMTPEWDVVKDSETGETGLKKTGRLVPKRHEYLPFAVDLSAEITYARDDHHEIVRRFTKRKSSWETKIPKELKWDNPDYADVINTLCKYSHQRLLKKQFGKTKIEDDKIKERKAQHKAQEEEIHAAKKKRIRQLEEKDNVSNDGKETEQHEE
jgi:hypothetical protein